MIIGLNGYAQTGKDTVADYLVREKGFTRVAFADQIKELLLEINPMIIERAMPLKEMVHKMGWEEAKRYSEVRVYLQDLGMGARKVFGDNIWMNRPLSKMIANPNANWVVTDVRLQNEARSIKSIGGLLWRVNRPDVEAANDHISEHDLDNWEFDSYIHNNSTIQDLEITVQVLLNSKSK